MRFDEVFSHFRKLARWCEKRNYKGYDPYDALTGFLPFHKFGKWPGIISIQVLKRLPVNIRPILGIPKQENPKALGLFLHAYSLLFLVTADPVYKHKADLFFLHLLAIANKKNNALSWGYPFPWSSPVKYLPAGSPTSVVSGFIAKGIFAYYQATKNTKAADALCGIANFILDDLHPYRDKTGISFSYSTVMEDVCYNASLLAAETLAMAGMVSNNREWKNLAEEALMFVLARQEEDGHWGYSEDPETGKQRKQIDFHQGYILDSIVNISTILSLPEEKWKKAVERGMDYYWKKQFTQEGRSFFRIPHPWPSDIHHQAQGIITFSRLNPLFSCNEERAGRILKWTIENLGKKDGSFAYRKYRVGKNTISFMRWGQAWMMLAMAEYLFLLTGQAGDVLSGHASLYQTKNC